MVKNPRQGFQELAKESQLYPQEQLLQVKGKKKSLFIGIPKEISLQERRVPLTPGAVRLLANNGHEVWIESGAGNPSKFTDKEFSDAGAKIVYDSKEIYKAEIVLKVEPPTKEEIDWFKPGNTLISALQTGNITQEYIAQINKKKITALAYELLEDKVGGMPAVRAMSEIAGSTVMLIAAELLINTDYSRGILLGGVTGVPPTKVVILGAGTVAEYAARAGLGLGAEIKIFDNHLYKLRRIKHTLGNSVFTSTLDNLTLREALKTADVVVGALRSEKGKIRFLVSEEMVTEMKQGSVIMDVSIDQGGCFETSYITTHDKPTFIKYGVIHYCVPNIPSRVPKTASAALSNIFTPILFQMADVGGQDEMIFSFKWFMKGIYAFKGSLTNQSIANKLGMKCKDLELLLAARF